MQFTSCRFSSCGLSSFGIKAIAEVLPSLTQVRKISIEMNPIMEQNEKEDKQQQQQTSDSAFASIVRAIPKSCKFVSFKSCNLSDADAEGIADILSTHSHLVALNLFGSRMSDNGFIAIANALRTNRSLVHLNMSYSPNLTNASLAAFGMMLATTIITGEETFQLTRERIYKSIHGPELELGQIPASPHLKNSKLVQAPPPTKKKPVELIAWDNEVERIAPVQTIPAANSNASSKPNTAANAKVQQPSLASQPSKATVVLPKDEPTKFKIPGNKTLKSISLSANSNFTDDGVKHAIDALQENDSIIRFNLGLCKNISDTAMSSILSKLTDNAKKRVPVK